MRKTEIYLLLSIILLLGITAIYLVYNPKAGRDSDLIYVSDGYAKSSVTTAVFRKNSLCTHDSIQFIAFYDAEGNVVLGKRNIQETEWELQKTQYHGNVSDAHRIISIAVDDSGYLHLAFNHHDSQLMYTRSIEPYSLIPDTLMPMTGDKEDKVTYPEFYSTGEGLIFAYRDGSSGKGNLILNCYSSEKKCWTRLQDCLIDGEGERNAYWQIYASEKGTIHISWVWRDSWLVESNHDMCYACSHDGGKTWYRSDGTEYTLPIRCDNAETIWKIPQGRELINQTSMTTDENDMPYIATYWRDSISDIPQYRLLRFDGKEWHMHQVSNRSEAFSLSGGGTKMIPIARPQILAYGKKIWYFTRDEEYGSKAAVYKTSDIEEENPEWQREDLTDFAVNAWEPVVDYTLWQKDKQISLFIQNTMQGDGEKTVENAPQPIYVMNIKSVDF